jgi:CRP-like cAMP-binding protein
MPRMNAGLNGTFGFRTAAVLQNSEKNPRFARFFFGTSQSRSALPASLKSFKMERFINYIKQFGTVENTLADEILKLVKVKKLQKEEYFLEAGKFCNQIGFIVNGVFRIFFYDKEGNEITRYFLSERHFLMDLYSFNNKTLSSESIQALTDSELIIIDRSPFEQMITKSKDLEKIVHKITENGLLEKLYKREELFNQDATTKYLHFLEMYPNIANRIPLGHLASYLGIKQQSLSRIRKEISIH